MIGTIVIRNLTAKRVQFHANCWIFSVDNFDWVQASSTGSMRAWMAWRAASGDREKACQVHGSGRSTT